jgi:hypothetical protein
MTDALAGASVPSLEAIKRIVSEQADDVSLGLPVAGKYKDIEQLDGFLGRVQEAVPGAGLALTDTPTSDKEALLKGTFHDLAKWARKVLRKAEGAAR